MWFISAKRAVRPVNDLIGSMNHAILSCSSGYRYTGLLKQPFFLVLVSPASIKALQNQDPGPCCMWHNIYCNASLWTSRVFINRAWWAGSLVTNRSQFHHGPLAIGITSVSAMPMVYTALIQSESQIPSSVSREGKDVTMDLNLQKKFRKSNASRKGQTVIG